MNLICLSGCLTDRPKLRYSQKNLPVLKISVANFDTRRKDLVLNLTAFGPEAETIAEYKAGQEISLEAHFELGKDEVELIVDKLVDTKPVVDFQDAKSNMIAKLLGDNF